MPTTQKMTDHNKACDTSNLSGADLGPLRKPLEEALVNDCADRDPDWVDDPDNPFYLTNMFLNGPTLDQSLARAGHFSEDVDNASENDTRGPQDNFDLHHQLTSHPMQCLCGCRFPPTNDSFYAGAIGDRRIVSPDTRPYNVTLKNINPRIVSAVIGKMGAVQQQLVREFYLKSLHISEPEDQVLDSGRSVSSCNIVLIGHNRDNVMAATKKVVTILKREEELYIEVDYMDYMDYRTHQRAFI